MLNFDLFKKSRFSGVSGTLQQGSGEAKTAKTFKFLTALADTSGDTPFPIFCFVLKMSVFGGLGDPSTGPWGPGEAETAKLIKILDGL